MVKTPARRNLPLTKTLVLVGMPGAGKSSVGRKLASRLCLPFVDSDHEVEAAAGMSVEKIFRELGEAAFREGEQKVIARLLDGPPCVLSTGGGAFMNEKTREIVRQRAISVWLKADLSLLLARTSRKDNRPLLKQGDPALVLQELLNTREPFYATADIVVVSDERPVDTMVRRVLDSLDDYVARNAAPSSAVSDTP